MHARLKPMGHRFSYRVMSLLIDLDRLDDRRPAKPVCSASTAPRSTASTKRDHGDRDGSSLRAYARRRAAEHGIDLTGGRVLLLCYPRLLGFTFNPLSVYFCYRADGELALAIYEVRNTFGDIHAYVLPVRPGELTGAGLRQQQDKLFYVSPFIDMPMRYHFRLSPPGSRRQTAHPRDRPLRPPARRDLPRPPPRPDLGAIAAFVLRAAAGDAEDRGGDPLGGAAALAQGRAAGAAPWRRTPDPAAIPAWRAANALLILEQSCKPRERRSGPVTVDARQSDRSRRQAGHRAISIDGSAMPELICVTPDNIDTLLPGPAAAGPAGARLRLEAPARHPRRHPARRPQGQAGRRGAGPGGGDDRSTITALPRGCSTAATSASPKPICTANGTRPI